MTGPDRAPLRTLSFGDLDAGVWGVVWGDAEARIAVGAADASAALPSAPASIDGWGAGEEWKISGDGIELTVSPETEAADSPTLAGFDQLCRVHGRAVLNGATYELDAPGRRGSRPDVDLRQFDSVRDLCAWFAPGDGLALTSLRPRGAKGHDRDLVTACVFEPAGPLVVADPRLSTTYTVDGHPTRVGLELWLDDQDSGEQYPRRAGCEPLGASAAWTLTAIALEARLMRCRSRGENGVGVYVLARGR